RPARVSNVSRPRVSRWMSRSTAMICFDLRDKPGSAPMRIASGRSGFTTLTAPGREHGTYRCDDGQRLVDHRMVAGGRQIDEQGVGPERAGDPGEQIVADDAVFAPEVCDRTPGAHRLETTAA